MSIDKNEMDIDNFIRDRLAVIKGREVGIEPSCNFTDKTMARICEINKRKLFLITYGVAISLALTPAVIKYIWLYIRNDYFSLANIPMGSYFVPFYQLLISVTGSFILIGIGLASSALFIKKQQHQQEPNARAKVA
jgi:hypothetical protein